MKQYGTAQKAVPYFKHGGYEMDFHTLKYERPDLDHLICAMDSASDRLSSAATADEAFEILQEVNRVRNHAFTMMTIAEIRNSLNTTDSFYETEQDYYDEHLPQIEPANLKLCRALVNMKCRKDLEERIGRQLFDLADIRIQSFRDEMIPLMVEENRLTSEFQKLEASAAVPFMGKTCNLSDLIKYMRSDDRTVRKDAYHAYAGFYASHEADFDRIYDSLVHLRHRQAVLLGYENYIPLGYLRMSRQGYGPDQVALFRDQVARDLVPVCTRIRERQREGIGLDKIRYYDENVTFPDGNPVPKDPPETIVENAGKMFRELSSESGEFFDMMRKGNLMDLVSRPGKAHGGYCTFLPDYKVPFIFSNFNGTDADVEVLTHESGHAFQAYMTSLDNEIPEYGFSTSEAAEIHSGSMEFFTYPWMELFFGDGADRYRFQHAASQICFIPYGVLVDEFQHRVYAEPDMTPDERKQVWRELERKYLPERDYDGEEIFEKGGFYFQKQHIFRYPFYYIDYTFAYMASFEFFARARTDRASAWRDYMKLCRLGGKKRYLELLFSDGYVKKCVGPIVDYLNELNV